MFTNLVGEGPELAVTYYDPGQAKAGMSQYAVLAQVLHEQDPDGIPVPYMMPAVTDGRFGQKSACYISPLCFRLKNNYCCVSALILLRLRELSG